MSVVGEPTTHFDRYDWAMLAATAVAMVATMLLSAALWAGVIVAWAGSAIIGCRSACHTLGLFRHSNADEPETTSPSAAVRPPASTPPSTAARPPAGAQPSNAQPAAARNR
ncbi:MAG: hypothetical protein ACRDLF_06350 [Solirubrobacteraceae bacterium]